MSAKESVFFFAAEGRENGKGGYGGVLLLLSHDRALLPDVCDTIVILDGEGNTRVFDGTYCECEARQMERSEAVFVNAFNRLGSAVSVAGLARLSGHCQFLTPHLSEVLCRPEAGLVRQLSAG